ncbi:hypothetical protein COO91_06250 [Nostoc flagelliforme CCNUN1]|uniref:Uncharacterized protein n=1 Tax=Nostoc flagelliforme CCNUN1 TaxID=2038116 RepID=A0A2K8SXR7_9NOSO|nr:hypothetical protein COO91_06250 [Nostoc flagelliforme CCNUN1]
MEFLAFAFVVQSRIFKKEGALGIGHGAWGMGHREQARQGKMVCSCNSGN